MAATTAFHPSSRSKNPINTIARTVPTNCTTRWRFRDNQDAIRLLSQDLADGIGGLLLRLVVRAG